MKTLALAALGAALLVSGCNTRAPAPPPVAAAPSPTGSDNKVWARVDGQRMAGNPALTRQGQSDLKECREQSAVSPGATVYQLRILNECMERRGYKEIVPA